MRSCTASPGRYTNTGRRAVFARRTRTQLGFSLRPLVPGSHLFAVLVGSTVDTCYVSLQRLLWEIAENVPFCSAMLGSTLDFGDDFVELLVFSALLGSTVALGDDFVEMVVFSALLGSTLDTVLGDTSSLCSAFEVRQWVHGAASFRGHSTGAAL